MPAVSCRRTACLSSGFAVYLSRFWFQVQTNEVLVQGDSSSPMAGVEGDAAASSAIIHDLACLLQCDPSPSQALPVMKAISAAINQLLSRLPRAFLEPILPPGSLNDQQVLGSCASSSVLCIGASQGCERGAWKPGCRASPILSDLAGLVLRMLSAEQQSA